MYFEFVYLTVSCVRYIFTQLRIGSHEMLEICSFTQFHIQEFYHLRIAVRGFSDYSLWKLKNMGIREFVIHYILLYFDKLSISKTYDFWPFRNP